MNRYLLTLLLLTQVLTPLVAEAGRHDFTRKRPAEEGEFLEKKRQKTARIALKNIGSILRVQVETNAPSSIAPTLDTVVHLQIHLPEDTTLHAQTLTAPANLALPTLQSISIHPHTSNSGPLDISAWARASWREQLQSFTIVMPEQGRTHQHRLCLDESTALFLAQTFPNLNTLETPTQLPLPAFTVFQTLGELTLHRSLGASLMSAPSSQSCPPIVLPTLRRFRANQASLFELIHLTTLVELRLDAKLPDREVTLLTLFPVLKNVTATVSEAGFHALSSQSLPWQHLHLTVDGRGPLTLTVGAAFTASELETLELLFTPNTTDIRPTTWRPFQIILPKLKALTMSGNGTPEAFDLFVRDIVLGASMLRSLDVDNDHTLNALHISPERNPLHGGIHPWFSAFYDFMSLNWLLQDLASQQIEALQKREEQRSDSASPLYFTRLLENTNTLDQIMQDMAAYTRQTSQERLQARAILASLALQPPQPDVPQVFEIGGDAQTSTLGSDFYPTQHEFGTPHTPPTPDEERIRRALTEQEL